MILSLLPALLLPSLGFACTLHHAERIAPLSIEKRAANDVNWTYEASYDWHTLSPSFATCQTGTQQSPIGLPLDGGLSYLHQPSFNFANNAQYTVNGSFHNWGYGPSFTVDATQTQRTQMTFDNSTLYMQGWHVHAPADHSVGGDRSKAELHIVWANQNNTPKAVLAIRLDAGQSKSNFFAQMENITQWPRWDDTTTQYPITLNFDSFLRSPNYFSGFWTYSGSLTSPPCTEGIRWFVARQIHFTSVQMMQRILAISTYSARVEQEVWLQGINA